MTTQVERSAPAWDLATCDPRVLRELRRTSDLAARRGRLVERTLLAADAIGLLAPLVLVLLALGPLEGRFGRLPELGLFCLTLPVWALGSNLYGLSARDQARTDHGAADELGPVLHLVTIGIWGLVVLAALTGATTPDITRAAAFWALAVPSTLLARAGARRWFRRRPSFNQNAIVLGADDAGQRVAAKLVAHPECGIHVLGFVDGTAPTLPASLAHLRLLGAPEDIPELVRTLDITRVVVAFSSEPEAEQELIRGLSDLGVQIDLVPRFPDLVGRGLDAYAVEGMPLLGLSPVKMSPAARVGKRLIDLVGASLLVLAVSPLLAVIALAIKLDTRGPVFFRQVRMGSGGRYFRIWKFRTMVDGADAMKPQLAHLNDHATNGDPRLFKIRNDPRVTRVGRYLRHHYLDEFPQLFNVLSGDMSLVGPRPLILSEASHVNEWALTRLDLRPGMTGLWQVLGGSAISFGEMVRLDYVYVTNWSLRNDLRLLFQTIPVVLRGARAS